MAKIEKELVKSLNSHGHYPLPGVARRTSTLMQLPSRGEGWDEGAGKGGRGVHTSCISPLLDHPLYGSR